MNNYKLGSLFDGSGGFPLAGTLCGIEPVWAAEVEPYPIAVTRSRFPRMKHLGDISKVNGAEIEPVDIITFGSPCQDLSVAGKRAGLKHTDNGDEETTRSGLFMEAVRIIKEMRNATNGKYPTFALWENVPGAFSSNKGEDFRVVCEELIKIVEPTATMPEVPQKGWNYADSFVGDGWSLAYRVLDAQYWGVPQRRRRIYLVADFRGERAREVLFEREGLRGYFTQGRTPWQTTPSYAQGSSGADDREGVGIDGYNGDLTGDKSSTLGVNCGLSTGRNGVIERGRQLSAVSLNWQAAAGAGICVEEELVNPLACTRVPAVAVPYTLKIRSGCEGGGKGALIQKDKSATLACNNDQCLFQPTHKNEVIAIDKESYSSGEGFNRKPGITVGGPCATLQAQGTPRAVCYAVENHPADSRVDMDESGKVQTLTSRMGTGGGNVPMVMEQKAYEWHSQDLRVKEIDDATAPTLPAAMGMGGASMTTPMLICEPSPVICLQGNGIDRADTAGCNGKGWKEDTAYTLNTIDRPAVAYSIDEKCGNTYTWEEQANTLAARDYKQPQGVAYQDKIGALCARDYKGVGGQYVDEGKCVVEQKTQYIVRRLTPTECARLQGFADRWGDIDAIERMSAKDYEFWKEVRNTHATINGKKVQDYTVKQMLTWYNKLQTDSAEYKMWGNGIALPTALYVMQGITDALIDATLLGE